MIKDYSHLHNEDCYFSGKQEHHYISNFYIAKNGDNQILFSAWTPEKLNMVIDKIIKEKLLNLPFDLYLASEDLNIAMKMPFKKLVTID